MIDLHKIYNSNNYGDFKVTKYIDCKNVKIEFLATGYRTTVEARCIKIGNIKDYLAPSVFGVAYIGIGKHKVSINRKHTKTYTTWRSMLQRCYDQKYQSRQPAYEGCSVCDEWHNFQNFAEWFEVNYIKGYHLDKDIKIKGNRVYSPDACLFVSQAQNSIEASAKRYKLISPQGDVIDIYNLTSFCRENKLDRGNMYRVLSGEYRQHKGWAKCD